MTHLTGHHSATWQWKDYHIQPLYFAPNTGWPFAGLNNCLRFCNLSRQFMFNLWNNCTSHVLLMVTNNAANPLPCSPNVAPTSLGITAVFFPILTSWRSSFAIWYTASSPWALATTYSGLLYSPPSLTRFLSNQICHITTQANSTFALLVLFRAQLNQSVIKM